LEIQPRTPTHIAIEVFDGLRIPFGDGCFDWVILSDVLHHATYPMMLLAEARRVASQGLLIKDHYRKGFAAVARLRLMDWVGNRRFRVPLPYNYWSEEEWRVAPATTAPEAV
jgi:SAM-dependent methyltransferase